MSVSIAEQETTINIMRDKDCAEIYTSDSTMMTRLDKLAENKDAPDWQCVETIFSQDGELVAKRYRTAKKLVSFRTASVVMNLTEEQRKELADRLRKATEAKKAETLPGEN